MPLEVQAIYTRKAWWSTGLGSRLMEVAIGKEPASLWVLEGNERAQAFYRRKGFVEDGTVADEPFFDVTELRMVRRGPSATGTDVTQAAYDVSWLKHGRRTGATRLAQSGPTARNPRGFDPPDR